MFKETFEFTIPQHDKEFYLHVDCEYDIITGDYGETTYEYSVSRVRVFKDQNNNLQEVDLSTLAGDPFYWSTIAEHKMQDTLERMCEEIAEGVND